MDTPILVTVVGMVLAALGAAVTAVTSYMTNRDKLRFDAERIKDRADIAYLKQREKECLEETAEMRKRIEHLEEQLRIINRERK